MATKVKSAAEIAEKWGRVTAQRSGDYEAGVKGAGADWEANTVGAQKAFQAAVSAANIGQMFAGGVKRAGSAKYERKASGVGKDRFSGGVNAGVPDMQSGMQPMVEAIAAVTKPARGPRGDVMNRARSEVYQVALNKKRLALRAAGG